MANELALGVVIGATVSGTVGRAFQSLESRASQLGTTLTRVQIGRTASNSVIQYRTQLATLQRQQQQFGVSNTNLWGQIAHTQRQLREAERAAEGYGINIGDIVRENNRLVQSEQRVQRQLERTNTRLRNRERRGQLQGQIMGTVGVALAATAPIKVAVDFEQSIAKLGAITNADKKQKAELQQSARMLGKTTQFTASESASAMTFLGMAGFKTNEILSATPGILNLAQAAGADLASTADVASNILSGFSLNADQMNTVGDVLSKTMTTSNVNLSQLGETMKYAASAASSVGGSIQEVAAMAGLLGNIGIQGSMSGTAIKSAYLRMAGNKAAKEAIKELGVSTEGAHGKMKKMPAILKEISLATKDMSDTDKLATISKIFGAEAASSMIELTKQAGTGELDAYISRVTDSMGTSTNMAKKMGATTQGALKRMGSAFESVQISIGSALLPVIADLSDSMATGLSGITSLTEEFPLLTKVIIGAVVGLAALKVITLGTSFAATVLSDGWTIARAVFDFFRLSTLRANAALVANKAVVIGLAIQQKAMAIGTGIVTAAQWAWNVALNANPIGLVIAGIVAFGALALTVYKKWEPIKLFFADLWKSVSSGFGLINKVGTAISGFFSGDNKNINTKPDNLNPQAKFNTVQPNYATLPEAKQQLIQNKPTKQSEKITQNNTQTNHITITQQPGEDTNGLAERVIAELDNRQNRQNRGALHDGI